jgi:hypothetical protein
MGAVCTVRPGMRANRHAGGESAAAAGAAPMQGAQATHGTAPAAANGSPISTMRASPIPPGLSQAGMALAAGAYAIASAKQVRVPVANAKLIKPQLGGG